MLELALTDDGVPLRRTVVLEPVPVSAPVARRMLSTFLTAAGRLEWVDSAALAVTEIVTNAVLHAHTDIELTVQLDHEQLLVEVRDESSLLPRQRAFSAEATTGRGMDLVTSCTSASGVRAHATGGKVVWFVLRSGEPRDEPSVDDLLEGWSDNEWEQKGPGGGAAAGDGVAEEAGLLHIRLLGMPLVLWKAARAHNQTLLREYALYRAEHEPDQDEDGLGAADAARSGTFQALEAQTADLMIPEPASALLPEGDPLRGTTRADLDLFLPPTSKAAFHRLQQMLEHAEALALDERMLVRPALPEIVAVRTWALTQITDQLEGAAAAPWYGSDDPRFELAGAVPRSVRWDVAGVRGSARAVVAVDDATRILAVSDTLAAGLGWAPEALIGLRVVAMVPHRLREAHVAGFSRHIGTGVNRIIGTPVRLPMLRHDGTEVTVGLLIEHHLLEGSRSVYLAWVDGLSPAD